MEPDNNHANMKRPPDDRKTALFGIPTTMITAGICLMIVGVSKYPPLDNMKLVEKAILFGGLPWAPYVTYGHYMLRQRGAGIKSSTTLAVVSAAGFFAAALGSIIFINGALDSSPPNLLPTMVMDKETAATSTMGWTSSSYRIHVKSWRAGAQMERLDVDQELYQKVAPFDDIVFVTTRSGWLGFEWVSSVRTSGARQ